MESKSLILAKVRAHALKSPAQHVPFAYTAIAALAPAILLAAIVIVASSMASV